MEVGFELDLDYPLEHHRVYSLHDISNDDIADIIESLLPFQSISFKKFDRKNMILQIKPNKAVRIFRKQDVEDEVQLNEVKLRMKEKPITQIIIDAQRTILGTEFLVIFLKALQKEFPKTAFSFIDKLAVCGNDIQKIWIRESFLKDPSLREFMELDNLDNKNRK